MLKRILISSVLFASVGLVFSGCNNIDGKYHKVVSFDEVKNEIVVEYRSDKITYGYFLHQVEEYCSSKHRIASINKIKVIDKQTEQVSFSCIIDD